MVLERGRASGKDGNGKSSSMGRPFLSMLPDQNIIRELEYNKDIENWLTLANMLDAGMAQDFSLILAKCDRYNMVAQRKKYENLLKLLCSIKSQRAWMVQMAIAGVSQAMDFGDGKVKKEKKESKT